MFRQCHGHRILPKHGLNVLTELHNELKITIISLGMLDFIPPSIANDGDVTWALLRLEFALRG